MTKNQAQQIKRLCTLDQAEEIGCAYRAAVGAMVDLLLSLSELEETRDVSTASNHINAAQFHLSQTNFQGIFTA